MEVPLMVLKAEVLPIQLDVMPDPGAKMSTHGPKLEKEDLQSTLVVAPTVMAAVALAGD